MKLDIKNNKLEINDKEIYIISTPTIKIMESCFKYVMEEHAKIISKDNIDIIEIGFGMGFFANYIQDNYNVNTHTIVEIHPQIIKIIKKWKEDELHIS